MLLTFNHFKMAYNKACTYKYKRLFDIDYCYTFSSAMSESRIKHLFKEWYTMNVLSYNNRYNTNENIDLSIIDNWDYEQIKEKPCNAFQMLKLLQCIRYQIEDSSFNDEQKNAFKLSLEVLNKAIEDIKHSIVCQMDEYQNAKWCID